MLQLAFVTSIGCCSFLSRQRHVCAKLLHLCCLPCPIEVQPTAAPNPADIMLSYCCRAFAPALVTVFATDSSIASLPVTLRCAAEHRISDPIARFVLPLGATINMNGTAFFEALTVIFIAQVCLVTKTLETSILECCLPESECVSSRQGTSSLADTAVPSCLVQPSVIWQQDF